MSAGERATSFRSNEQQVPPLRARKKARGRSGRDDNLLMRMALAYPADVRYAFFPRGAAMRAR